MSIELVMLSNHLILCRPLLLLPSIFPSIRVFSNESALCISWPSIEASALASVLLINIQGWFPLGLTGLILLSKGLSRAFSSTTVQKHQFFSAQPSFWSTLIWKADRFYLGYLETLHHERTTRTERTICWHRCQGNSEGPCLAEWVWGLTQIIHARPEPQELFRKGRGAQRKHSGWTERLGWKDKSGKQKVGMGQEGLSRWYTQLAGWHSGTGAWQGHFPPLSRRTHWSCTGVTFLTHPQPTQTSCQLPCMDACPAACHAPVASRALLLSSPATNKKTKKRAEAGQSERPLALACS